jgi:hypothetical protein
LPSPISYSLFLLDVCCYRFALPDSYSPDCKHLALWRVCVVCCERVQSEPEMSESIRYESAERVRDFYREQGRKQERERIIDLLMQLPVSEATYKLIQSLKGERNA